MYDVITVGTLTVDMYFQSENLTAKDNRFELAMGGKYFTDHFHESLGGGATNVAIGLSKHGYRTSLVTMIGQNSFKPMIMEKLQDYSVSYIHSKVVEDHLNISCILLSNTGEKTVINYQSPHQHLFEEKDDLDYMLRANYIFIGNLPDVSYTEKIRVLSFLRKNNKKVIMNFGVIDCRRAKEQMMELIKYTDVVIVNGYEFADIVKTDYERIHFKKNIIPFYFPEFKEKTFIVTDGKKGSYGYGHGKHFFQEPIHPSRIVDSTGAGDGYSAGFISEYIKEEDIEKSMLSGAEYAAKILAKIGAH
ncbi:MAG: carbohydrate kinase family protein [Patescibacteria group bacterium]